MNPRKHMVSVLPVNGRGEVLLQQRDQTPGIAYPGCWTMFGGAVEDDDPSFEAAIKRELQEELALDIPVMFWLRYRCPVRSTSELDVIVHVYVGELNRPLEELTLLEGQALGWFDWAGVKQLEFAFEKQPVVLTFLMQHEKGWR